MPKEITKMYNVVTHTVVVMTYTEGKEPENVDAVLAQLVADRLIVGAEAHSNDAILCKELIHQQETEECEGCQICGTSSAG